VVTIITVIIIIIIIIIVIDRCTMFTTCWWLALLGVVSSCPALQRHKKCNALSAVHVLLSVLHVTRYQRLGRFSGCREIPSRISFQKEAKKGTNFVKYSQCQSRLTDVRKRASATLFICVGRFCRNLVQKSPCNIVA
jgi:hypothetical protein